MGNVKGCAKARWLNYLKIAAILDSYARALNHERFRCGTHDPTFEH
jgi:hypothetical protein